MGGKQYLVIVSDSGNFQIIANSVESVIGFQGFSEFGEHRGIGVLEGLQQGLGLFIPIPALVMMVVLGGHLSKLLKGS
jgi:hypothetical protein